MITPIFTYALLAIAGGYDTQACEYPSTAALGHCSGVLVHPQVVLTAAHCFPEVAEGHIVRFGATIDKPVAQATASYCEAYPGYDEHNPGADWAYCWFDQPILDVPVTPIANQQDILELSWGFTAEVVGFGRDQDNQAGRKKVAQMDSLDLFRGLLFLEEGEDGTACRGDSGGPVYAEVPGAGWRVLATVSFGPGCRDWEATSVAYQAAEWVRQETGVDLLGGARAPRRLSSAKTADGCAEFKQTTLRAGDHPVPTLDTNWYAFPPDAALPAEIQLEPGCGLTNPEWLSQVAFTLLGVYGITRRSSPYTS